MNHSTFSGNCLLNIQWVTFYYRFYSSKRILWGPLHFCLSSFKQAFRKEILCIVFLVIIFKELEYKFKVLINMLIRNFSPRFKRLEETPRDHLIQPLTWGMFHLNSFQQMENYIYDPQGESPLTPLIMQHCA